jgi:AraC-like DNA-binding protein
VEPHSKLSALVHPYARLEPVRGGRDRLKQVARRPGSALVWRADATVREEVVRLVRERPGGLALIVILPPATVLEGAPELLQAVLQTRPHGILPHHGEPTTQDLAEVLRRPPADLGAEVTDYLAWRGLVVDRDTRNVLRRIVDLSDRTRTVTELSRAMYLSRRALGRRLANRGLPVPSHWLQMARVLRLVNRLQNSDANIFSIAYEFGYPDGFSVSNQMHRLVGFRPSVAREHLGWEWVLEAWLRREANDGGLVPRSAPRDLGDKSAVSAPPSTRSLRTRRPSREPTP